MCPDIGTSILINKSHILYNCLKVEGGNTIQYENIFIFIIVNVTNNLAVIYKNEKNLVLYQVLFVNYSHEYAFKSTTFFVAFSLL